MFRKFVTKFLRLPKLWRILIPVLAGSLVVGGTVAGVASRKPRVPRSPKAESSSEVSADSTGMAYDAVFLEVTAPEVSFGDLLSVLKDGLTVKVNGSETTAEFSWAMAEDISSDAYFFSGFFCSFDIKIPLKEGQTLKQENITLSDNLEYVAFPETAGSEDRYDTVRIKLIDIKKHELIINFGDLYYGDTYEDLVINATLDGKKITPSVTYYCTMIEVPIDTVITPMSGHELDLTFEDLLPGVGFSPEETNVCVTYNTPDNVYDIFPFVEGDTMVTQTLRTSLKIKQHDLHVELDPVSYGDLLSTAHYTVTLDGKPIEATHEWFDYADGTQWNSSSVFGADVLHAMDMTLDLPNEGYWISDMEGGSGCTVTVSDNLEYVCALSQSEYVDDPTNVIRLQITDFLGEPYYYDSDLSSERSSKPAEESSKPAEENSKPAEESSTPNEESSTANTGKTITTLTINPSWPSDLSAEVTASGLSAPGCRAYTYIEDASSAPKNETNSGVVTLAGYTFYTGSNGSGSVLTDSNILPCSPFSVVATFKCSSSYVFGSGISVSSDSASYDTGTNGVVVSYSLTDSRTITVTIQLCFPHYGIWHTTKSPTCCETGVSEMLCVYCDKSIATSELPIDPNGHLFSDYTEQATIYGCVGTCVHCGEATHSYNHADLSPDSYVYEPTDDFGYHNVLCPYCGGFLHHEGVIDYCVDSNFDGYCDYCGAEYWEQIN